MNRNVKCLVLMEYKYTTPLFGGWGGGAEQGAINTTRKPLTVKPRYQAHLYSY